MTLAYFCYNIDIHLKENFRYQDLPPFFFRDTSGPCAPAIAFTSTANLSIAFYSRRAKGVPSYGTRQFLRTTYRFRDIDVERSSLILGALRKLAIFRRPLQRRLVRYTLHVWHI